jgi:L-fuconolactonase
LPAAVETVAALPELRFVLDHAGKPDIAHEGLDGLHGPGGWRAAIAELGALPNVAVKLSGLVTEAGPDWTVDQLRPYAGVLFDAFGADRIMFGSDWPVCLLVTTYDGWVDAAEQLTAELSTSEREAVFGGTAAHWYRLCSAAR